MQKEERNYSNFDVFSYIEKNDLQEFGNEFIIKVKVFYLIKYDQIYGTLTI